MIRRGQVWLCTTSNCLVTCYDLYSAPWKLYATGILVPLLLRLDRAGLTLDLWTQLITTRLLNFDLASLRFALDFSVSAGAVVSL